MDGPRVPEGGDTVKESRKRIWIDPPDRTRVETTGTEGDRTVVRVGNDWWSYSPGKARRSVGHDRVSTDTGEDMAALLAPASYVGQLDFEVLGESTRIDRRVLHAVARPFAEPSEGLARMQQSMLFHHWGGGAEEYELDVDCERGAILRLEARRLGEPFRVAEALAIDFDPTFSEGLFGELEIPAGETYEDVGLSRGPTRLALQEGAARAPFKVFVPTRVAPAWRLEVTLYAPRREREGDPWLTLSYKNGGPVGTVLHVRQSTRSSRMIDPKEAPPWEEIERAGVAMRVRGPAEKWPQSQVELERDGTRIALDSFSLPIEDVIQLALSLEPAEQEARSSS